MHFIYPTILPGYHLLKFEGMVIFWSSLMCAACEIRFFSTCPQLLVISAHITRCIGQVLSHCGSSRLYYPVSWFNFFSVVIESLEVRWMQWEVPSRIHPVLPQQTQAIVYGDWIAATSRLDRSGIPHRCNLSLSTNGFFSALS